MRILFDSKQLIYKSPFGTLVPGQDCILHVHIPCSVATTGAECIFTREDGTPYCTVPFSFVQKQDAYDIWRATFSLKDVGLFFYFFRITGRTGTFRLFKQGNDTNMEAGDLWQLSCIPADFTTPDWAKGAVIYQIFPDRFYKHGDCDLTGKLKPYHIHDNWNEEVHWQPDANGKILNNDFYGGNFRGITEKMDYIASLGTAILYLNPISKSFSSHRYDTGDYKIPDPMLGTLEDFCALCEAAHARGIRVVLDGVYSHTGSNSLYFDKERTFGGNGAYCSPQSPYFSWYTFRRYPDSYDCWWDFDTLPTVKKLDPAFVEYIITGEDSVVAHWLKLGADGFRLDVADELPNEFIAQLKHRIRQIKPDALLMGEVWEDASNKIAYDVRRRYFVDGTLDSVMNYPFCTAILKLLRLQDDGKDFRETVMTILENYPPQVIACNMNLLGTHDTPRILTALVDDFDGSRETLAKRHLSQSQKELALQRLFIALALQYTLPGAPSIYYGDEAEMEGHKDPFNRRTYPWGKENQALLAYYRLLGQLRKEYAALRLGHLEFQNASDGHIRFSRISEKGAVTVSVNLSQQRWSVPSGKLLLGRKLHYADTTEICLEPMGICITEEI